jgi:hypothetical protein
VPPTAHLYTQGIQSGCVRGLRQLGEKRVEILARQLNSCDSETTVTPSNVQAAVATLETRPVAQGGLGEHGGEEGEGAVAIADDEAGCVGEGPGGSRDRLRMDTCMEMEGVTEPAHGGEEPGVPAPPGAERPRKRAAVVGVAPPRRVLKELSHREGKVPMHGPPAKLKRR